MTRRRSHHRPWLWFLFFIGLPWSASWAQDRDSGSGPNPWPTTVDSAVADLLATLPVPEQEELRASKKDELFLLVNSVGTTIRAQCGLWRGNDALTKNACGKRCHPHDVSLIIMERLWELLNRESDRTTGKEG